MREKLTGVVGLKILDSNIRKERLCCKVSCFD